MAWDFTGGIGTSSNEEKKKKSSSWDFTGGLDFSSVTEKSVISDIPGEGSPEIKRLASELFVDAPTPTPAPKPTPEQLHPTLWKLTTPLRAIFENPWMERAGQAGSEVMGMMDRPDKVTTGSKFGDISADLAGGLMGFAGNPASVGAKLWGGTEQAISGALPLIPKLNVLPAIAQTGLKMGATTLPYEATRAIANDRPFDAGEAGTAAASNALLGMLLHGGGKALASFRRPGVVSPVPDVAIPGRAPGVNPPVVPRLNDFATGRDFSVRTDRGITQGELAAFKGAPARSGGRVYTQPKFSPVEAMNARNALYEAAGVKRELAQGILEPWQMTRVDFNEGHFLQGTHGANAAKIRDSGGVNKGFYILASEPNAMKTASWYTKGGTQRRGIGETDWTKTRPGSVFVLPSKEEYGHIDMIKGLREQGGRMIGGSNYPYKTIPYVAEIPPGVDPHKFLVEKAITEGKPVPAKVLKDYPDLQAKAVGTPGKGFASKPALPPLRPIAPNGILGPGSISAAKFTIPKKQSLIPGTNDRVRSFHVTGMKSPITAPETKSGLLMDVYEGGPGVYQRISHTQTEAGAKQYLAEEGLDKSINYVLHSKDVSSYKTGLAKEVITELQNKGGINQALDVYESMAEQLTRAGQMTEAAKLFNALTPDGVVLKATRDIKKAAEQLPAGTKKKHQETSQKVQETFDQINKETVEQVIAETPQLDKIPAQGKPGIPRTGDQTGGQPKEKKGPAPAEMLAQRVKQHVAEPKEGEADPIKDMVNTLFKKAKEVLPEQEVKRIPRDEMEFIKEAIANKQKYGTVWNEAKKVLQAKYGDKPEVMNSVESFISHYLNIPYSEKSIGKITRAGIRGEEIDLAQVVRQHYTMQDKTGRDLVKKLVDFGSLPQRDAEILALEIGTKFDELAARKKQQVLDQIFKQRGPIQRKPIDQKIIEWSNMGALSDAQYRRLVAEKMGLPVLTDDVANSLRKLANEAQTSTGRKAEILRAQIVDLVAKQIPTPFWRKVASIQTMAQLLNPKTAIRNIVGNFGFAGMENVSGVVGAGVDKALSLATGQRTKVLPSLGVQAKGFKQGWKYGLEDARLGIDTSGLTGKFDIPLSRTFRKGPLGFAEKALNIELRATDRAFYQAAYDGSLNNQMRAAKVNAPTEEMRNVAHLDGLYKTFQDDNALSKLFVGIKQALNKVTGSKEFGAGDFIIKYPRTPANLLMRGIDYSPAGFVKTILEAARPLAKQQFNQKAFVESFSRALVGSTALFGTGVLLHKLGIITGRPAEDRDLSELNRQSGFGEYRINASALKRLVFGGGDTKPQKGDTIVSYDWFQPQSIPLAIGADVDANKGSAAGLAGTILQALGTGVNAFAEQPVMQGIQTAFSGGYGNAEQGLIKVLEGVPASFIPTLLNQVKQLADNQRRETYDPNKTQEALNRAGNKIPGLAGNLPRKYGTLGQPLETYQGGSNNPANVFLNPAFINQYNPSREVGMVNKIYEQTGETSQIPRVMPKKITVSGKSFVLTGQEYSNYQRIAGELTQKGFAKMSENMKPEEAVKKMQGVMSDANEAAKTQILKARGERVYKKGSGIVVK